MKTPVLLTGSAAAPGIAIGPALIYRSMSMEYRSLSAHLESHRSSNAAIDAEMDRLKQAIDAADNALLAVETQLLADGQEEESHIFGAHRLLLTDPELRELALTLIADHGLSAAEAIIQAGGEQAALLETLNDPFLNVRAADMRDVVSHVRRILMKDMSLGELLTEPAIVVAHDLGPSELMSAPRERLLGLALTGSGPTAHATILARAWGIPAVIGLGRESLRKITQGMHIAIDAIPGGCCSNQMRQH
ncbi:MAG: hypothetical protein HC837_12400 [Chloroflexaceae bacterium]|nr:hypothetical protein [Chloroflexaceae bacterium]